MGDKVFVADKLAGKAAIYVEPDTEPKDAPFTDPVAHLEAVEFDTEALDYMEVAAQQLGVTINHPEVAAGTFGGGLDPAPVDPNAYVAVHDLLTHNKGFEPFALVNFANVSIPPGMPIQALGSSLRLLTPIVTSTKLQLIERVISGDTTLPAGSFSYDGLVFDVPATGDYDLDIHVQPGEAYFRCGTFDSSKRYLRVADSEDSEFRIWIGPTIDLANAVARIGISPTTVVDDVHMIGTPAYNYDGSFSAADLQSYEVSVANDDEQAGATFIDIGATGLMVVDQGNVVFDTSRRLAGIFQIVELADVAFSFPDPPHDYVYRQRIASVGVAGSWTVQCITLASILPQEWSQTIELATLDSDKGNFLLGLVKGSRTTDPDQYVSSLGGSLVDVAKLMEENVTIVTTGSMLLERAWFIRRSVTFKIEGNKLVAVLQQSTKDHVDTVSTIDPYGLGPYDDASASDIENVVRTIDQRANVASTANVPLYLEGGPNACSIVSPYDFSSVWTFSSLRFAVGRITPGVASA